MQSHKDLKEASRNISGTTDIDREEAAIDALLTRETERIQAASALAAVARRHAGKLLGGPAASATAASSHAAADADFQTLVRQELHVARGHAIVETEKRARRASVEMAEAAEAAARASISESLRTGRPFTSQSAGRGSRRGSGGGAAGAASGRRGSVASVAESLVSAIEAGDADGMDALFEMGPEGSRLDGDGRPTTAASSVGGRPYSGVRHRTIDELRVLGTYGVVDPAAGRADPIVYVAGDAAARPTTPGMALAMLQSGGRATAATVAAPHLLVANFGTSKRRIYKDFARAHALRVSVATTPRAVIDVVCDRSQAVTAILADLSEGTATHRTLIHDMQRQLSAAGFGAVLQRDFAGAGTGALVPFIVVCPPMAELVGDASGAGGDPDALADLLTCIELGADCAVEKPIPFDQLAVRVRVLHARHSKAQAVLDQIRAAQAVRAQRGEKRGAAGL